LKPCRQSSAATKNMPLAAVRELSELIVFVLIPRQRELISRPFYADEIARVETQFENDIRRERQMDGIKKARERGIRFGRKPLLVSETIQQVRKLRKSGKTVPEIMRQTCLSKASVYRALADASPVNTPMATRG